MLKNKKNLILCIIIFVIIIIIGIYLGMRAPKSYSGVYLTTGEIYVGKLSQFPTMTLRDVYLIKTVIDEQTQQVSSSLIPLVDTVWSPVKIKLNKQNIIFYGEIGTNSTIAQTLNPIME